MKTNVRLNWKSDCGHFGICDYWKGPFGPNRTLAAAVRAARQDHDKKFPKCDNVDICNVEDIAL